MYLKICIFTQNVIIMRAAIYGAGSLGTILGAYIARKGVSIDLVNRNKAHIEALKANGATVTGTVSFNQKVNALHIEEMSGKYDIIFLMTKQLDNAATVAFLGDYLEPDGVIVTLQNGLPEVLIGSIIGEDRVIGCTVAWGATMQGPGVCELTSEPDCLTFSLGTVNGRRNPRMEEVKSLLENMGEVEIDDNFIGSRWSKLLINSTFSGLSAVFGCTFGETVDDPSRRRVAQAIMKECFDVCAKGGIRIAPIQGKDVVRLFDYSNCVKKRIAFMLLPLAIKKHRRLKASMLQDLEKGKLTEVDAINGSVCAFGRKVGCPTPFNDKVVDIVHKIESGVLKPSFDNLKLFNN